MKELKFRAWCNRTKRMFSNDDLLLVGRSIIEKMKILHKGQPDMQNAKGGLLLNTDDKNMVFTQYIGLKDDNDEEIYEGDILQFGCPEGSIVAIVEFGNPNSQYSWGWQLRKLKGDNFNMDILLWVQTELHEIACIVIGNAYENPELLEVK